MATEVAAVAQTPEQENAGGGSGFHLVTQSASGTAASIETSHIAGHKLVIVAYGDVDLVGPLGGLKFTINGQDVLTSPRPQNGQFFFDAVVFINPVSAEVHVLDNSPLADVNTRQSTVVLNPFPKTIVFGLKGTTAVHSFQVWKLGLK